MNIGDIVVTRGFNIRTIVSLRATKWGTWEAKLDNGRWASYFLNLSDLGFTRETRD